MNRQGGDMHQVDTNMHVKEDYWWLYSITASIVARLRATLAP